MTSEARLFMKARLVGSLVILGLCAMFVLNLVWIGRNRHTLGGTRLGQPAPEIDLERLEGGRVKLSEMRGQLVVLSFWATWCGPCVQELPDVQRLADEFPQVRFLLVDVDGGEEVRPRVQAFKNRLGLRLPIALDDGSASQAYRVDTIPRTIVVGKDGSVAQVLDGAHPFDEMRRTLQSVQ